MFYAHFVLAKKGPLARIWLAAHWDKKLTKAHVFETNIEKSVDGILQPKVKMALRTSGHLLLGVVRIYSRKAKYLLADCNEAFVKIKMAFRPGVVDLPEDIREAAVSAITLPEVFHDFDTPMPELNDVDIQAQFTLNQSRAEEITMREEYGSISLGTADDGFGDMEFEGPSDIMRANAYISEKVDHSHSMFSDSIGKDKDLLKNSRVDSSAMDLEAPIQDDGFGGNFGQDITGGLFGSELFGDSPMVEAPPMDSQPEKVAKDPEDSDDDGGDLDRFEVIPSVGSPSSGPDSPSSSPRREAPKNADGSTEAMAKDGSAEDDQAPAAQEQTTLIHNEEESFALAPIDASAIKLGWPRTKRKRKLIVDEIKNISGEEMKAQLSDTTDIVTTLDLAPPSKRLMHWKETGGVEKLFALPGNNSLNPNRIGKLYQTNLAFKASIHEDLGMAGDDKESENLRLEQVRDDEEASAIPRPRGRPPKRKIQDLEVNNITEKPTKKVNHSTKSFDELLAPVQEEGEKAPELEAETSEPLVNTSDAPLNETRDIHEDEPMAHDDMPAHDMDDFASPKGVDEHQPDDVMDSFHNDAPFSPDAQPPVQVANQPISSELPNNISNEPPFLANSPPSKEVDEDQEEQADDETYEEYEERIVNKRAGQLFHSLKRKLANSTIAFSTLSHECSRKQVAQKFYTLLVLKKLQAVELQQDGAYAEITVSRGGLFEKAVL